MEVSAEGPYTPAGVPNFIVTYAAHASLAEVAGEVVLFEEALLTRGKEGVSDWAGRGLVLTCLRGQGCCGRSSLFS